MPDLAGLLKRYYQSRPVRQPEDCSACHNMLAVEEKSPAVLKGLGLEERRVKDTAPEMGTNSEFG